MASPLYPTPTAPPSRNPARRAPTQRRRRDDLFDNRRGATRPEDAPAATSGRPTATGGRQQGGLSQALDRRSGASKPEDHGAARLKKLRAEFKAERGKGGARTPRYRALRSEILSTKRARDPARAMERMTFGDIAPDTGTAGPSIDEIKRAQDFYGRNISRVQKGQAGEDVPDDVRQIMGRINRTFGSYRGGGLQAASRYVTRSQAGIPGGDLSKATAAQKTKYGVKALAKPQAAAAQKAYSAISPERRRRALKRLASLTGPKATSGAVQ